MLETSNFVHGSAMQSLSLVMSECFLSGRGQGNVSNFYTVDLENFATARRRYTCAIHNSTVVGLFMTHCLQLGGVDGYSEADGYGNSKIWRHMRCLRTV